MKLIINYDLMEKIKHSKDGIKATEMFFKGLKGSWAISLYNFASFIIDLNEIVKNQNVKTNAIAVFSYVTLYSLGYGLCSYIAKRYKNRTMDEAAIDLQYLANQLYNLEVKTSAELLEEAKINQVNYKIVFSDNEIKIPKLKQYKYIDIPLSNGYEETLLQEHVIGEKNYELSVDEPVKKHKFKLARAGNN